MSAPTSLFYWTSLPNRDQALEAIYSFLRALAKDDKAEAAHWILIKDMTYFQRMLQDSLLQYLDMVIEDEEWDDYEDQNLILAIDDPSKVDEDLSLPEFSGKHFELVKGETISVQLGLHGQITPIRLHFALDEHEGNYFVKIQRITAK